MTFGITSQQATQNKRNDLVILDEQYAIMKEIITQSQNGVCNFTIDDGTTMTESTPTITITGTQANPTIVAANTVILGSSTVVLGTSGTNLNAVIADINDANISGVVASKSANNELVITYTTPAATTWTFDIGAGTANAALGLTNQTYTATDPSSVNYFNVWQGNTTDKCDADDMKAVITYFENLGYVIERQTNNSTSKTFKWRISY